MDERIKDVISEVVDLAAYDPQWPQQFKDEKDHLLQCLPGELINRIEHFGSTAVPDLAAKPIIDILVEVTSLEAAKENIVPILEKQGYDYFWRPTWGDDTPPFYAWFIKRNNKGERTHHIHMVEKDFPHWDRLFFRDYLIEFPAIAKEYKTLKYALSNEFKYDRIAYTNAKTEFIKKITDQAKSFYQNDGRQK